MNKNKALLDKWSGFINESIGVDDAQIPDAKAFIISAIAQNKQFINESVYSSSDTTTVNGIGAVALPASPGTYTQFHDPSRATGQIDKAMSALNMSINIAAHTIGFDLVPTVPIYSELIMLDYTDFIYTGGRLDSATKPLVATFTNPQLKAATLSPGDVIWICGADTESAAKVTYIQRERLTGDVIARIDQTGTFDDTTTQTFTQAETVTINAVIATAVRYIIGAVTDTIVAAAGTWAVGFTSVHDDALSMFVNGGVLGGEPMQRQDAENGTSAAIEFKTYTKPVSVKAFEVIGHVTRAQSRVLKTKGIDAVPQIKNVMEQLISQAINDDILTRMRKLGVTTHANLFAAQGINFNLFIGPAATANKAFTAFTTDAYLDKHGADRTSEFGNIINAETNSSAENLYSRQRRVVSRILGAATFVGHISRFGAADAAVIPPQFVSAVKESKGFTASTITNNLVQNTKNLYYLGDVAGVKIYCNPKLRYDDESIVVARTNKTADGVDYENINQGVVLLPYDLAASESIIAESTMSHKILVESLYAIAETGIHPELAYLTFAIHSDFGHLM
jgi:hypothetical protein